jgi:hypothetical protein
MSNYCLLDSEGLVLEVAVGFLEPPFKGTVVEAPDFVVEEPDCWKFQNGQWMRRLQVIIDEPQVNQELADAYEVIAALYEETEALKARIAVLEGR